MGPTMIGILLIVGLGVGKYISNKNSQPVRDETEYKLRR